MYLPNSSRSVQHQSPLKMPLAPGVASTSMGHTSPVRHVSRRSSSPGRQSDNEASIGMEFSRRGEPANSSSRMTQSFISSSGLSSAGSSASLLPYQYGNGSNRTTGSNFAASKTKSMSLLIDRAAAELNSSGRRRMVAALAQPSAREQSANSGNLSGSTSALPYDRDQSLDRHVERRPRHRGHRADPGSDAASRYHTIGGYGRDRGMSAERGDYPHMGARALERIEQGLMRSRSIDPEFVSAGNSAVLNSENSSRLSHDSLIMELQSQVNDLSQECATLQRDLEMTRDKLNASMNSVRTFWSPELKRERAQRKDDSSRLALLVEQIRIAEVENRQLVDTIKHLEKENRTLRDFSLTNYVGGTQSVTDTDTDAARKDREKHVKELKLLKRTIEEMELRIETQKQTLSTRDESIHKLMDMLQSKARGKQTEDMTEETRHIQQLEQLLEQKEGEVDAKCNALERELKETKEELLKIRKSNMNGTHSELEAVKSLEKQFRDRLELARSELMRSEAEIVSLQAKVETLEKHQEDNSQHIAVIRQQLSAKEEQTAMLQSDLDMLHNRLREKDELLEKKSKILAAIQTDKKHLETETTQLSERLCAKEKEIATLQRKIESLEDTLSEKESSLSMTKARLMSLKADHNASGDAVSGLETLLADKDKQIERLKEQRERAEQRFSEEKDSASKKQLDLKNRLESLQSELNERQISEAGIRDELLKLKSERLTKESHISRLELAVSENVDQINELQRKLQLATEDKEMATKTSSDQLGELRKELEGYRAEASRVKVETNHLSAALRDAESTKKAKDKQIKQLMEQLEESETKIAALKERIESDRPVNSISESGINTEVTNEEIAVLKSLLHDRDSRISELEEALRESIRITAQREVVMAEMQMKLEHTERMMESLQEEIDGLRRSAAETAEQLSKARSQLNEKDEDYISLQADSKRQLIEVYEMKQEAILAAISEKDAHIALLEMAPNKKTENIDEVEKLSREKQRLQQVLKELTQSRMNLLQNRHLRSQSHDGSGSFYKSESHEKDDDGL